MNSENKRTVILVIIAAVALLILGPTLLKGTLRLEKTLLGVPEEEITKPPKIYYKSDLDLITGTTLRERKDELSEVKCTRYWSNGEVETPYDNLTFYIFKDEKKAERAFSRIRDDAFVKLTDEGTNYVRGWLSDTQDASVEQFYYINGNLIVTTTTLSVYDGPISPDTPTDIVRGSEEEAAATIALILSSF